MSYSPTTWVTGTTVGSAANMNNIETGISTLDTAQANFVKKDGSVTSTASQKTALALGGTQKVLAEWQATDGKDFQWIITTAGHLKLRNVTDSIDVLDMNPSGGITTNGATVWSSANDGSSSGLDADTVDGISSTGFMRLDSTATGAKWFGGVPSPLGSMADGDYWAAESS